MSAIALSGDVSNVTMVAPTWDGAMGAWIPSLEPDTRTLVVSYVRPAEDYLTAYRERTGREPASFVVVEARTDGTDSAPEGVDVRTESPDRLTGIGIQVNETLTRWRDSDAPVAVYFDSITALLQYVELDVAYRFLHPFTGQVRQAGARGFYRMSEDAHDAVTVSTLEQLFDGFLQVDGMVGAPPVQQSAFT